MVESNVLCIYNFLSVIMCLDDNYLANTYTLCNVRIKRFNKLEALYVVYMRCWLCKLFYYRRNFSENGIVQLGSNSTHIQCTSTHLTSFAVLVDASGEVESVSIT